MTKPKVYVRDVGEKLEYMFIDKRKGGRAKMETKRPKVKPKVAIRPPADSLIPTRPTSKEKDRPALPQQNESDGASTEHEAAGEFIVSPSGVKR